MGLTAPPSPRLWRAGTATIRGHIPARTFPRLHLLCARRVVYLEWKLIGVLRHGICWRLMRRHAGPEGKMAVLGGALAVPCTCNPLQQG